MALLRHARPCLLRTPYASCVYTRARFPAALHACKPYRAAFQSTAAPQTHPSPIHILPLQVPTLWVLEGLTYYLEPASVPVMLGEIGSVSPPGSALVGSIASAAAVARIQVRELCSCGGSNSVCCAAVVAVLLKRTARWCACPWSLRVKVTAHHCRGLGCFHRHTAVTYCCFLVCTSVTHVLFL